mgnify:CR=1 FL=1
MAHDRLRPPSVRIGAVGASLFQSTAANVRREAQAFYVARTAPFTRPVVEKLLVRVVKILAAGLNK